MPGICVFPSKTIKLEDASEDQVWQSLLCAVPRFIPSCDHRRFSKWRKYAIWQKIFFLRLRCLSGWQQAQCCRAASALPSPATASSALLRLLAAHPACTVPRTPGTDTPVTASTSNPLPDKAWPQRTCYSIIFCGLFVWNIQLPQIRNYCHMGFVSFYFYNHWHLYLMDVY